MRYANQRPLIALNQFAFISVVALASLTVCNGAFAQTDAAGSRELPTWKIPNVPHSGEAYYGPDSVHVIAQVQDPDAVRADDKGEKYGNLTYTFTDRGADVRRINDKGQDGCSYFFPDGKHLIWTSTRDHPELPVGSWNDANNYPTGAELYVSDLKGGNIRRLTNNKVYDAEVSVSPNGEWIVFGRQIDGKMDLWRMRADGSGEEQLTFTDDWQEGAPFYLPDNKTILFRAWKRSEYGKINPPPMTVFTLDAESRKITPRTFDHDMNWAPYPTPDGQHYVFVRIIEDNNWEVFLGDIQGGPPVRLTYNNGFDGFPSVSPDGQKMLFARKSPGEKGLFTWVMDISSLNVGPKGKSAKN